MKIFKAIAKKKCVALLKQRCEGFHKTRKKWKFEDAISLTVKKTLRQKRHGNGNGTKS